METDLLKIAGIIVFMIICNFLAYSWYTSKAWNYDRGAKHGA